MGNKSSKSNEEKAIKNVNIRDQVNRPQEHGQQRIQMQPVYKSVVPRTNTVKWSDNEEIVVTGYCRAIQISSAIPIDIIHTIIVYSRKTEIILPTYIEYNIVGDNAYQFQFINEESDRYDTHYNEQKDDINDNNNQQPRTYKLLLLGAGQVGKHTIYKQLYSTFNDVSDECLQTSKEKLIQNTICAMRTLSVYSDLLNNDPEVKENTKVNEKHEEIRNKIANISDETTFTEELYNDFKTLWNEEGIRNTAKYRHKFQLVSCYQYLFENMHRFYKSDYIPSKNDYIYHRDRITGIKQINIKYNPEIIYDVFVVGGQRNEVRMIQLMSVEVSVVVFVVNLNGYNKYMYEDDSTNRMDEEIQLFGEISNSKWFRHTHLVLLLNKYDLFKETLKHFGLNAHWKEDFKGNEFDEEDVIEYFLSKFLNEMQKTQDTFRYIHCFLSNATDTNVVIKILNYVHKNVIMRYQTIKTTTHLVRKID